MRRLAPFPLLLAMGGVSLSGCATGPEATMTARTAPAFVAAAASSDLYEIESSRLALRRSRSAGLRMHAEMMIRDHGNMGAQLREAAASSGIGVPARMLPMHAAMLDELARSPDFDAAYRSQQVSSHRQALALMERYARRGDVPQLRGVAAAAVPVIRGHLDHVSRM